MLPSLIAAAAGCAQLHHVQLGDIDNSPGFVRKPIDIKLSESGINVQEAAGIVRAFDKNAGEGAEKIAAVIGLFQMGPRTGNPVYVKDYAKNLIQVVYEKCPSGRLTKLKFDSRNAEVPGRQRRDRQDHRRLPLTEGRFDSDAL